MNQTSKKRAIDFRRGQVVRGKWHHHHYTIISKLGHGAIGSVYLCESNGKQMALKISEKSSSVTMEVNVLKTFQKVQGNRLGPSLLDVDDWVDPSGVQYSFYVMEYLRGKQLSTYVKSHGEEWLGILMLQLLGDLESLHQQGWVFGDLKTENLIVTYPPARMRWIDVGGTTQIGRSIKEYTEFFDRGYWNMGTRKAEPSYDLFALAMVMVHFYHPKRFERGSSPKRTLLTKLNQTTQLKKYESVLKNALTGQYQTSEQMKRDLSHVLMEKQISKENYSRKDKVNKPVSSKQPVTQKRSQMPQATQNKKSVHPILESLGITLVVMVFYLFYLFLN
ncbi:protein kinase domain-containing protein [Aquibacillus kalidii]|uniref:protein kinase domain-containing protein n=1 Tax=Aquibacillus kalidii TaxID=2762597 RepID=UPI001649044F|nr:serine/threonine-protein kinase [Aquibacillus kalidii]